MNCSAEKFSWLAVWIGFAMAFAWSVATLAQAYDRSLARVNNSFLRGFVVLDRVNLILGRLDSLDIHQRAFLSTGDTHFQDGVIENVEALEIETGILRSEVGESASERACAARLAASVKRVLAAVGTSDSIMKTRGAPAAIAFFNSRQAAVAEAKSQAEQLSVAARRRISATRSSSGAGELFHALVFDSPPDSSGFAYSARLPARAVRVLNLHAAR